MRDVTDDRWSVLAGLRFVLALIVVAGHLLWFAPGSQPWVFLESFGGTSAVIGFLIISGYSIAHSLQRSATGFYRRRLLRIYPLYAVAVLLAIVPFLTGADALRMPGATVACPSTKIVIGNMLMLQNLICLPVDSNILVWTLGIEVALYLLAPIFHRSQTIVLSTLLCISAGSYAAYPRLGLGHFATLRFGIPLLMFSWAWIAGFLLHRTQNSLAVGAGLLLLCVLMTSVNHVYGTLLSVPSVALWALIITTAPWIRIDAKPAAFLRYLGDLSYPLYLFHLPTFLVGYGVMNIASPSILIMMAIGVSSGFLFVESTLKPVLTRKWNRSSVPTAG